MCYSLPNRSQRFNVDIFPQGFGGIGEKGEKGVPGLPGGRVGNFTKSLNACSQTHGVGLSSTDSFPAMMCSCATGRPRHSVLCVQNKLSDRKSSPH